MQGDEHAALVGTDRRDRIGEAVVEGYRRQPQTDDEIAKATRAALVSIEEEPW